MTLITQIRPATDSALTMRALVLDSPGSAFREARIARPQPGTGQVLVRIAASGVNPLDTKIRAGAASHAAHPLPNILGIDMAGVVEAVGPDVTGFRPGDEVYGMTGGVGCIQGSLAEYAAVDATLLAPKPDNLSMREAAAMPLAFITAWEGLVDRAHVAAGQTVLVQGGAGGVGHMAVQIARYFGASIWATASAGDAEYLAGLGATPIDYRTETAGQYVNRYTMGLGFDVIYNTGGGQTLDEAFQSVARFGHVVSALGWGEHKLAPLSFRGASYSGVFTLLPLLTGIGRPHHGDILREATKMAEAGLLVPRLDARRYGPDDIEAAHRAVAERTAKGKVVVEIA